MKMIIEAHLVDDVGQTERVELATICRELTTDPLGMSLAEGKALLSHVQQYLVKWQCQSIASAHAHCDQCNASVKCSNVDINPPANVSLEINKLR